MQASFKIHTPKEFTDDCRAAPCCPIRNARLRAWRTGTSEIIEQHFDGRYGYLYAYEINSHEQFKLPVSVIRPDLHGLYLRKGVQPVELHQQDVDSSLHLAPGRARFLYTAKGRYLAKLPPGKTVLFGFMMEAGLFKRQPRPLRHLQPLLRALEKAENLALTSTDFTIGPLAQQRIERLCKHLNPQDLGHESLIIAELIALIKLSRNAVLEETSGPDQYVRIARKLMAEILEKENRLPTLQEIVERTGIHKRLLTQAHFKKYQCTLIKYRDGLVVRKAIDLLQKGVAVKNVAYTLGYSDTSGFCRFFRRQTGRSPGEYKDARVKTFSKEK